MIIPYIMESKKCLKPPTSYMILLEIYPNNPVIITWIVLYIYDLI